MAFHAIYQNGEVQLEWSTATEIENRGFFIERSGGNTYNFQNLAWLEGAGNSSLQQTYRYSDRDIRPGETYYYRLQQTDFNGNINFSVIRSVTTGHAGGEILLQPNPAQDKIRIQWPKGVEEETAQIIIVNADGGVVQEMPFTAGMDELEVKTLPPGLYLLQVAFNGKTYSGKFFKS